MGANIKSDSNDDTETDNMKSNSNAEMDAAVTQGGDSPIKELDNDGEIATNIEPSSDAKILGNENREQRAAKKLRMTKDRNEGPKVNTSKDGIITSFESEKSVVCETAQCYRDTRRV